MRIAILSLVLAASASAALAQVPQPAPEVQKLGYFVGRWTGTGEMKASPFGPAGPLSTADTCEWFAGNFHVICHGEAKGPIGPQKSLAVFGYDADAKRYTYSGFDSFGSSDRAHATVDGNAWNWVSTAPTRMGGKSLMVKYTIQTLSPSEYTWKWEASADGGPYQVVGEGRVKKTS